MQKTHKEAKMDKDKMWGGFTHTIEYARKINKMPTHLHTQMLSKLCHN